MQTPNLNRYLLSTYAESVLETFQLTACMGCNCKFLMFYNQSFVKLILSYFKLNQHN